MIKINYALDFALVGSKFVPCKYMYFGCKKVYFGKYYFTKSKEQTSKYLEYYKEQNNCSTFGFDLQFRYIFK